MSQPTFLINEIFTSIEGETSFQGQLMLFIRFTGCNLRCTYCDTEYAYKEGRLYSLNELLAAVSESGLEIVHLTGGEPLCQDNLKILVQEILKLEKKVLIETNGSLPVADYQHDKTFIMLDIKTPDSGEQNSFYEGNLKVMRAQDEFKFVISGRSDYEWSKEFYTYKMLSESPSVVNFSPALPVMKPELLAEWMVKDELPVRFNLQIHKYIWPDTEKGV